MHMGLKTALLQNEEYEYNRDVVCALPPEAGHPSYIGARLKKPAYGMNDAPRRWWNKLDAALRSYDMIPTRADRCCYVLYSQTAKPKATPERVRVSLEQDGSRQDAIDYILDPIASSPAHGKTVSGVFKVHDDDLFGAGNNEFEQRVLVRTRCDFQVGSEDWNDVEFVGQRFRWKKGE